MTRGEYVASFMQTQNIDDLIIRLEKIRDNLTQKDETITKLNAELKQLRDEYDKDADIVELKEEINILKKRIENGFDITEEEKKAIEKWQETHERKVHKRKKNDIGCMGGCIGGCYTYLFIPTSIGVIGTIKCTCGKEFTFRELD